MLQSGDVLDGYRVIRPIGRGGFGEVWLCQNEALGDLRALKFLQASDEGHLSKEFEALSRYRAAVGRLRSTAIMPIEHANRRSDGLFYVMPLADAAGAVTDPQNPEWEPLALSTLIERRRTHERWFSSDEVKNLMAPILHALQLLSEAGLVHRDVKPENILLLGATPCLADISLLDQDAPNLTRRGTPGYLAPSWYLESGGNPDMFGVAATLYTLLTGNPPDKLGRSAFRWPPQGEQSLPQEEHDEWLRMHAVIRRAVDDRPNERFADFITMARILTGEVHLPPPHDEAPAYGLRETFKAERRQKGGTKEAQRETGNIQISLQIPPPSTIRALMLRGLASSLLLRETFAGRMLLASVFVCVTVPLLWLAMASGIRPAVGVVIGAAALTSLLMDHFLIKMKPEVRASLAPAESARIGKAQVIAGVGMVASLASFMWWAWTTNNLSDKIIAGAIYGTIALAVWSVRKFKLLRAELRETMKTMRSSDKTP